MNEYTPEPFQNEEWRPISGFEGLYEISSQGRVKSLPRLIIRRDGKRLTVPGRILKTNPNGRGYPRVSLCNCGISIWIMVHSIVAATFLPPPPGPMGSKHGEYTVNHKDGNKINNHVDNLEYVTGADNVLHSRRMGLLDIRGSKNGRAKVGPEDVRKIRQLYAQGYRQKTIAAKVGVHQTTISRIILRKGWGHIT
jgi:hypothetical protein